MAQIVKSATFKKLSHFILRKMRMSHIYQPVMLMKLLRSKGKGSVKQIAKTILQYDPSQIEYYEQITKDMVGRVLTNNHWITSKDKDSYSLVGYEDLSSKEVRQLIEQCEEKLDE